MPASLSTTLAMKKERGKEPIDLTIVTQRGGLFAPCLQAASYTRSFIHEAGLRVGVYCHFAVPFQAGP